MGCDIHCYIEYRNPKRVTESEKNKSWNSFGNRINPGRNYLMFSLMAGIRSDYSDIKPKGLPDDIGYNASGDNFIFIVADSEPQQYSEGYVKASVAERYVKGGSVYKMNFEGKPTWVSNPDWHSHSWLSLEEFKQVLKRYVVEEHKDWEQRESERLGFIESTKKDGIDIPKDSWLFEPCGHYVEPEYYAIAAAMEKFEEMGYESRLVFWFDN